MAGQLGFIDRPQRVLSGARIIAERLSQSDVRQAGITVLTGGADVHLVMVDLREAALDGQAGEDRLAAIGIIVNRNAAPFDPRPPMISSGLRFGTPALAAGGFTESDFAEVADIIAEALIAAPAADPEPLAVRVAALARRFPLYPGTR